jgi:glutaredoxin
MGCGFIKKFFARHEERNSMEDKKPEIIIYGTTWCGQTRMARVIFDQNHIPYQWIDIDQDSAGRRFVEETNHGYRSVPTIVFLDGSILVEPTSSELSIKLGLK